MEEFKPNRNRSRQVKFWISEDEYDLLQKKMEATGGVNQGAYIRKMILDGYIVYLDIPELKEIIRLPNKIYVKIRTENSPTGQAEKRLTGGAFFDPKAGRKAPTNNNKSNKYIRKYEFKDGESL